MINVIISDAYLEQIDAEAIERAAQTVLQKAEPAVEGDLSVVIEDDARLHQLNKDFLDIDAPTDVLSFPSGEETEDPETGRTYLGDVILSYPRAVEQAEAAGHSVMDEIQLLVVHGTLHLLGHDHGETDEKARMWAAQEAALASLNVQIKRLPE